MLASRDPATKDGYTQSMNRKIAEYKLKGIKFMSLYVKDIGDLNESFPASFRGAMGFDLFHYGKPI